MTAAGQHADSFIRCTPESVCAYRHVFPTGTARHNLTRDEFGCGLGAFNPPGAFHNWVTELKTAGAPSVSVHVLYRVDLFICFTVHDEHSGVCVALRT